MRISEKIMIFCIGFVFISLPPRFLPRSTFDFPSKLTSSLKCLNKWRLFAACHNVFFSAKNKFFMLRTACMAFRSFLFLDKLRNFPY